MRLHRLLPAAPVVAALALSAAGCGNTASGKAPDPPSTVKTSLSEFSITPSRATAGAGKVTVSATNNGKVPHELIVIRTDKPASGLGTGSRIGETGSVGEVADVAPGKTKSTVLDLKAGHYALICNLPGHYMGGMRADLTVR